jgi:hypothetical protein
MTGFTDTMESWDPRFVNALAQDYRVIIIDNARIGETQKAARATDDRRDGRPERRASGHARARAHRHARVVDGSMIAQALTVRQPSQLHRLIRGACYPATGRLSRRAVPN